MLKIVLKTNFNYDEGNNSKKKIKLQDITVMQPQKCGE